MFISKFISKVVGEKGRWREYKARTRRLPANYRAAVEAVERYLMYFGGGTARAGLRCTRTSSVASERVV
jgi:DNA-binding ferritin-like protein (Dps family)